MASVRLLLFVILAQAPLVAAQAPACNPCVDGPEMFEHRQQAATQPVVDVMASEDLSACRGPLLKTYGGLEWLVSDCIFSITVRPAPGNLTTSSFTFEHVEDGYRFAGSRPHDKRAREAYKHLRSLEAGDIATLVAEIRDGDE